MSITSSIRRGLGFQAMVLFVAACADPFGAQSGGLRAPDINALRIEFHEFWDGPAIDTIPAGREALYLMVDRCAGDFLDARAVLLVNQDTLLDGAMSCSGTGVGSGASGSGWTAPGPGTYRFTIILDADNTYRETNENNNVATAVLEVIP